ncbi:LAG1 longevity assurance 2 [Tetrabaena socialis]|uniref:LAG1 longevity assurance 2 n=1 Tax=Tetrabaena socialis TaxID=47790 RepID=A0A2J7ZQQ7_9CHLO|nr:LAG1 longevity assurance 2 [Tetrabaena socialis]|eukprot:PNH02608.1 LAG1 longevity assurance 2 [Tetrabaena socialis]
MVQPLWRTVVVPNLLTPGSKPDLVDFVFAGWVALLVLAARVVFDRTAIPRLAARLHAPGGSAGSGAKPKSPLERSRVVLDSAWIAAFAACLAGFAWWVTVWDNGGCTPWSTTACFAEWPNHPVALGQRLYMVLAFAYYLYELAGTVLGIGTRLKADMVAHHIVTMALILIAYQVNLKRMSVMWQALFDISNPILHTAKALNASGVKQLGPLKWLMFNLFALTFLVCRVLAGPVSILWPSFTIARDVLPASYCYTCWGLMVFVYALQLLWFYKIVDIAVKGDKAADKVE